MRANTAVSMRQKSQYYYVMNNNNRQTVIKQTPDYFARTLFIAMAQVITGASCCNDWDIAPSHCVTLGSKNPGNGIISMS